MPANSNSNHLQELSFQWGIQLTAAAIQGLLANPQYYNGQCSPECVAEDALDVADAILAEMSRRQSERKAAMKVSVTPIQKHSVKKTARK